MLIAGWIVELQYLRAQKKNSTHPIKKTGLAEEQYCKERQVHSMFFLAKCP